MPRPQRGKFSKSFKPFILLNQQQFVVQMKVFINCEKINELNRYCANIPNFQSLIESNEQKFQTKLSQQTATSILKLAHQINEREKKKGSGKGKDHINTFWVFGERKIFCWALIFYTHMHRLALQQMNQTHLLEIQTIFPQRTVEFLKYEVAAITSNKIRHKDCWAEPETQLLSQIVEKISTKSGRGEEKYDWRQISFALFCESNGQYFKPLQDCREKWCNYLNPHLNKQQWTLEEDARLFQLIETQGCKWALISRKFQLIRTQHMVKNRYNAYINNWKSKRSNVKSKRGLTNRILRYLRARLSKKLEKREKIEEPSFQFIVEDSDKLNEYNYSMGQESEEANNGFPNTNALKFRQFYDMEKKEKKTAESDACGMIDFSSQCVMIEQNGDILPYGLGEMENEEIGLLPFNYQMLMNPMEDVEYRREGKQQMKLIEADVVRALGCSHFQRALDFTCNNQFEEGDSFSWLS